MNNVFVSCTVRGDLIRIIEGPMKPKGGPTLRSNPYEQCEPITPPPPPARDGNIKTLPARRSSLARRTPLRPHPDHRVARRPGRQERALDPDELSLAFISPVLAEAAMGVVFRAGSASSA